MTTEKPIIRPLTRQLVEALMWDAWPSAATCVDFGIRTAEHLGALQYAYKHDEVTEEQFDAALGKGREIQKLISEHNPYRDAIFSTDWDLLPPPEDC